MNLSAPPSPDDNGRLGDISCALFSIFNAEIDRNGGFRGTRGDYWAIGRLYLSGEISVRVVSVPIPAKMPRLRDLIATQRESHRHVVLKMIAAYWLGDDALMEYPVCGRADVYSPSKDWIVECGNTNPSRLFNVARSEVPPRLTIIPFQWRLDHLVATYGDASARRIPLRGFDFTVTPGAARLLDQDQLEAGRRVARARNSYREQQEAAR